MSKQLIISVGREYGSGGHIIAEKLAERFGLPLYDSRLIHELAAEKQVDAEALKAFDEGSRNPLLSRTRRGYSNSPEEILAELQFDLLRRKADSGESFVIVGRCADYVLRDYEGLFSIFVVANMDFRIKLVEELQLSDGEETEKKIRHMDKKRKSYHNVHADSKWGDSRSYDICIDSSKLGLDTTADVLENHIRYWMDHR